MAAERVLEPEIGLLKNDEYYLFYEMMMQSLRTDDVKEGINKSLYMLRTYLKSGHIVLFRKNEDGNYVFKISDSNMDELVQPVSCIVNKTKPLIEQKGVFNLNLGLSERLDNITFLHIGVGNKDDCVLAILNTEKNKELEPLFWDKTKDTLQIILKRAVSYERNVKAVTTDLLTDLDNRNSYEMRKQAFNEADEGVIFGIFDLFRLKYINDNYSHTLGDTYIQKAAKILSKYWPKAKTFVDENGIEKSIPTGHCVYRVGGDEFVLITTEEMLPLASIKAGLARDESFMINLGLGDETPLGLNYGIVEHKPGDALKETIMRADELMQEDKTKTYKKYNIERRR